jgi:hypothetical protein
MGATQALPAIFWGLIPRTAFGSCVGNRGNPRRRPAPRSASNGDATRCNRASRDRGMVAICLLLKLLAALVSTRALSTASAKRPFPRASAGTRCRPRQGLQCMLVVSGDGDDRRHALRAADLADYFETAHLGHLEILQDQIWVSAGDLLQSRGTVVSLAHSLDAAYRFQIPGARDRFAGHDRRLQSQGGETA